MQLKYVCPYWGQDGVSAKDFLQKVVAEGYDGVEVCLLPGTEFARDFAIVLEEIRKQQGDFLFIAQQWLPPAQESVEDYIRRVTERLEFLVQQQPLFINAHTGKDYFSFDDNCRVIEATMNIAARSGVRILHETHRGRFSFHSATLLPYLERFPELELTADFSHWCTVSESLLEDQQHIIERVIPHTAYIHARVGYEQGPQVADPSAPEWEGHLARFLGWWFKILSYQQKKGTPVFTICPEAGPAPYMPAVPFTGQPLASQWKVNAAMKNLLKQTFHHYTNENP
jgi:sugar phosphate isomerase/epimerase